MIIGWKSKWEDLGFSLWSPLQVAGADQGSMFNLPYGNLLSAIGFLVPNDFIQFLVIWLQFLGAILFTALFLIYVGNIGLVASTLAGVIYAFGRLDSRTYHVNMLFGFYWFGAFPFMVFWISRFKWGYCSKLLVSILCGILFGYSSHIAIQTPFVVIGSYGLLLFFDFKNVLRWQYVFLGFVFGIFIAQWPSFFSLVSQISESTRAAPLPIDEDRAEAIFGSVVIFFKKYDRWWWCVPLILLPPFSLARLKFLLGSIGFILFCFVAAAYAPLLVSKYLAVNFDAARFIWLLPFGQAMICGLAIDQIFRAFHFARQSWGKFRWWDRLGAPIYMLVFGILFVVSIFFLRRDFLSLHQAVKDEVFQESPEVGFRPYFAIYGSRNLAKASEFLLGQKEKFRAVLIGTKLTRGLTTEFDPAVFNAYGFETLDGYSNFYPKRFFQFWLKLLGPTLAKDSRIELMLRENPKEFKVFYRGGSKIEDVVSGPMLSLANTKYVFTPNIEFVETLRFRDITATVGANETSDIEFGNLKNFAALARSGKSPGVPLRIYENVKVMNRFFVASKVIVLSSENEVLNFVSSMDESNLKDTVVLQASEVDTSPERQNIYRLLDTEESKGSSKVTQQCDYPSDEVYGLELSQAGVLVVSRNLMPGWEAFLDGNPVTVFHAYGPFSGVFVPSGIHTVRFRYNVPWASPFVKTCPLY